MLEERVEQWNRELIEKGRLEGLDEGRREGRLQGEARLLRQMTHRFGPLPSWVASRLAEASDAELDALAEALLDTDKPAALFPERSNGH